MRTSRALWVVVVLAMVMSLVPITAIADSEILVGEEFLVTGSPGKQVQTEMWGDIVVFRDNRTVTEEPRVEWGESCGLWDIWAVDLSTGEEFEVDGGEGTQNNPSVYENTVVWSNAGSSIGIKDLSTGETDTIEVRGYDGTYCNPFVWGDTLAWVGSGERDRDIWIYDLSSGEATIAAGGPGSQDSPEIYEDKLVYRSNMGIHGPDMEIRVLDLTTMTDTQIAASTDWCQSPSIWGDWVTWSQDRDVWAYNTATEQRVLVADGSAYGCTDISEGIVVWADRRNTCDFGENPKVESDSGHSCDEELVGDSFSGGDGVSVAEDDDSTGVDIYAYDLFSQQETLICDAPYKQFRPRIHRGTITWVDMREKESLDCYELGDIWGLRLEPMYSRVEGDDRFETATQSARKAFPSGCDTVVIATGFNWPDALVSSSLAGAVQGPVLLTRPTSLPAVTAAEIQRLGAQNAYVIGGEAAVSEEIFDDLTVLLDGFVERIAGTERRGTANLVARKAASILGSEYDGSALVVTSVNYPDALCAAPAAAAYGTPMFLAGNDGIAATSLSAMRDIGVTDVVVVGGEGAVSADAEAQLDAQFGEDAVERVGGLTRYHTAVNMAQYSVDEIGMHWDGLAIATGQSFPDALTGGVLQGLVGSTLMLTPGYDLHPATEAKIVEAKGQISRVKFLGGVAAISDAVRDEVEGILEN